MQARRLNPVEEALLLADLEAIARLEEEGE